MKRSDRFFLFICGLLAASFAGSYLQSWKLGTALYFTVLFLLWSVDAIVSAIREA